jgi:L-alanine-DL-glutamate epimerase-like enolase superfamily enzyme
VEALARRIWARVGKPADLRPDEGDDEDGMSLSVRAALETALLDLGVLPGWPMDTVSMDVPVNATIAAPSPEAAVASAQKAIAAGFTTLKLKAPASSSEVLIELVEAVRHAVGPRIALRLDVNGAWAFETAQDRLAALAGSHLEYVEQPIPPGPPGELARLRAASAVPIAADESVWSCSAAKALLRERAADVLVVKPGRVGGPRIALAIARAAAEAGVGVVISTLLETGIGLAAALATAARVPASAARAHGLATGGLLADDLVEEPLVVSDGVARAPSGSGLGVRPDDAAIRRYAVAWVGSWW